MNASLSPLCSSTAGRGCIVEFAFCQFVEGNDHSRETGLGVPKDGVCRASQSAECPTPRSALLLVGPQTRFSSSERFSRLSSSRSAKRARPSGLSFSAASSSSSIRMLRILTPGAEDSTFISRSHANVVTTGLGHFDCDRMPVGLGYVSSRVVEYVAGAEFFQRPPNGSRKGTAEETAAHLAATCERRHATRRSRMSRSSVFVPFALGMVPSTAGRLPCWLPVLPGGQLLRFRQSAGTCVCPAVITLNLLRRPPRQIGQDLRSGDAQHVVGLVRR